jgi:hypothetical protein
MRSNVVVPRSTSCVFLATVDPSSRIALAVVIILNAHYVTLEIVRLETTMHNKITSQD